MNLSAIELPTRGTVQGRQSPQSRVFALTVVQNANPANIIGSGELKLIASGRTVRYDPTGSAFLAIVEASFDSNDPNGSDFQPLHPGDTFDFGPAEFNWLYLRSTAQFVNSFAGSATQFIGRLIISPTLISRQTGASAQQPIWTRPAPLIPTLGMARNGQVGTTNWQAVGGGTGIFAFLFAIPGITAAATLTGFSVTVRNTGGTPVYLSHSGTLTNGGSDVSVQQTFQVPSGAVHTVISRPQPNTPQNPTSLTLKPVFVYSNDAAAEIQYYVEAFQ